MSTIHQVSIELMSRMLAPHSTWTSGVLTRVGCSLGLLLFTTFSAYAQAIHDCNGDGVADVVLADKHWPRGQCRGRAVVYCGSTLKPLVSISGDRDGEFCGIRAVIVGDVDGDHLADVVVAKLTDSVRYCMYQLSLHSGRTGKLLRDIDCRELLSHAIGNETPQPAQVYGHQADDVPDAIVPSLVDGGVARDGSGATMLLGWRWPSHGTQQRNHGVRVFHLPGGAWLQTAQQPVSTERVTSLRSIQIPGEQGSAWAAGYAKENHQLLIALHRGNAMGKTIEVQRPKEGGCGFYTAHFAGQVVRKSSSEPGTLLACALVPPNASGSGDCQLLLCDFDSGEVAARVVEGLEAGSPVVSIGVCVNTDKTCFAIASGQPAYQDNRGQVVMHRPFGSKHNLVRQGPRVLLHRFGVEILEIGDFDRDGVSDVAVVGEHGDGELGFEALSGRDGTLLHVSVR